MACEARSSERTREVVDDAARTAERGVEQAKRGLGEARDEAREGLADARERYGVDDKVQDVRDGFSTKLDEVAQAFSEVAEAGLAHADKVGDKVGDKLGDKVEQLGPAGLDVPAEAVTCTDQAPRVCRVDADLIAKLDADPKLLVGEGALWPKQGATGQGLQLIHTRADGLTTMLGLAEGDILLSVNGAELVSFDAIRSLDKALSGKSEATLVYERNGQREQLTVIQQSR